MRKLILLSIILSVFLLGCGEAGFEVDISKENEVEITITSADIDGGYFTKAIDVNLAEEEFDEYLSDIESYDVNKISIQVVNYENSDDNAYPNVLYLGGSSANNSFTIFDLFISDFADLGITDANGQITEGDKILIYDKDDATNSVIDSSSSGLQAILTALESRSSMKLYVLLGMLGEFDGTLTIKVFFDITARTQQD